MAWAGGFSNAVSEGVSSAGFWRPDAAGAIAMRGFKAGPADRQPSVGASSPRRVSTNPQRESKNDDDGVRLYLGRRQDIPRGTAKAKQARNFMDLKVLESHCTFSDTSHSWEEGKAQSAKATPERI